MIRWRPLAAVVLTLGLAACGSPNPGQVETALERAWQNRPAQMAAATGLADPQSTAGVAAGLDSASRHAVDIASRFGGQVAAEVVGSTIASGADVAASFGVPGSADVNARLQRSLARNWDVSALEVLAQRRSSSEVVAQVRYSLHADTAAGRTQFGDQVTQTVRMAKTKGQWTIVYP